MTRHNTIWHNMTGTRHDTTWYNTTRYGTTQYNTLQHDTTRQRHGDREREEPCKIPSHPDRNNRYWDRERKRERLDTNMTQHNTTGHDMINITRHDRIRYNTTLIVDLLCRVVLSRVISYCIILYCIVSSLWYGNVSPRVLLCDATSYRILSYCSAVLVPDQSYDWHTSANQVINLSESEQLPSRECTVREWSMPPVLSVPLVYHLRCADHQPASTRQ